MPIRTRNSSGLTWLPSNPPRPEPFLGSTFKHPTLHPGSLWTHTSPLRSLAQNYIHFLGVPGIPAGEATIFVMHSTLLCYLFSFSFSPLNTTDKKIDTSCNQILNWAPEPVSNDARLYDELFQRDRRKLRLFFSSLIVAIFT